MAQRDLIFLYGQAVAHCRHQVAKVFQDYCTLQYMAGGAVELLVGAQRNLLSGRYFWSCYPGPRISFHPWPLDAEWDHHYIAFRGERVRHWREEGIFPVPPQRPAFGADYSGRFDELLALSRRTDEWGVRRAINVLEGILIELAEARARTETDAVVSRAIRVLHEADENTMRRLEVLAQRTGVSQRTLRRRFTAATGYSPKEYQIHQRIAEAQRMLAEKDWSIKQIAQKLAYKDVFFFTRQFTRAVGVPPMQYRRSCTG
jgi:AraC family transcriptional regulator of arabinose operon